MPQLFLVRKATFNYLGPMEAEEFKKRFDAMDFGMDDEVCGHCGDWIFIHKEYQLRSHYPQLAEFVFGKKALHWDGEEPTKKDHDLKEVNEKEASKKFKFWFFK